MKKGLGYQFTHTISRTPGHSISKGMRAGEGPDPDHDLFDAQHHLYLDALRKAGVETICLPPLEAYPDSVFVEDPALCLPDLAILLRPGASSRHGEPTTLLPTLAEQFPEVHEMEGPGYVDGGDVMVTDREILIGLSARTNQAGFAELAALLSQWEYKSRVVETPASILHFKTASAFLGDNVILCTEDMAKTDVFYEYELLKVPAGEEAAANAIRVNNTILVSAGYPKTVDLLHTRFPELDIVALNTSEAARVDGGLSCMSLRYRKLS